MRTINLQIPFAFKAAVLPPRCRKHRDMHFRATASVSLRQIPEDQRDTLAPVAFRWTEKAFRAEAGAPPVEVRWLNGLCYAPMTRRMARGGDVPVKAGEYMDSLQSEASYHHLHKDGCWWPSELETLVDEQYRDVTDSNRQQRIAQIEAALSKVVLLGDEVWQVCGEPRYQVNTFGLGGNHGGTALFVVMHYNSNISRDYYFRADRYAEAVAWAERVAQERGDTKSIPITPNSTSPIEVLLPEAVRLNPAKEHGEGDPFLNQMQAASRAGGQAGSLLAIASELSRTTL